ncbi:flagellar hook-length control protein FliK [Clostridium ljungdahlii]|uniref:Flagellar hook-length control protein FliK n=1 Tax=Clostridium ljungdahlii (strain ATCC 55383 / DSM 13528 / PETC) TaxID=748727 RepID=D8GQH2_CLOLD|nr:flagellar hook-length control protein FliK [Clostridium ljungdahlii]ADK14095.1 predicted flagellar hook-length control protein [Clostridium ljungdahlii DSM 13528]OAA86227.1 Flagellar hook-length control protein FliK [Clostridium ljungdahlii DSM 13528]
MNVNMLNLMSSMNVQTPKVQSSSSSQNSTFDSFVKSGSNDNNSKVDTRDTTYKPSNESIDKNNNVSVDKNTTKVQSSNSNSENKNAVDNEQSDDSKIETYLKKAGFTDEEIADIKQKIKDGSIDKNSVLSLLSLLFGNNQGIQSKSNDFLNMVTKELSSEISKVSTNGDSLQSILNQEISKSLSDTSNKDVSGNVKDVLNKALDKKLDFLVDILNKFDKSGQLTQKLSKKIADNIMSKLSNVMSNSSENDISDLKSQIYTELLQKLNPKLADNLNSGKNVSTNNLFQIISQNRQMIENLDTTGSSLQNSSNGNKNSTGGNSKNTDILNKILSSDGEDTKDNKISKAVNFMTQFNNVKGGNILVNATDAQSLNLNKATFNSDMIKTLKYMDLNDVKQLTVKINPKELGDITINLVMEEGKMKAVLTASNKDAYNLLNSNMQDLSNKLQNNDIKVQSFSLNLYHEDTTFFKNGDNGSQNQDNEKRNKTLTVNSIQEEDAQEEIDYYSDSNVNMLA